MDTETKKELISLLYAITGAAHAKIREHNLKKKQLASQEKSGRL